MRRAAAVFAAAFAVAVGAGGASSGSGQEAASPERAPEFLPARFSRSFGDGRIRLRYPQSWTQGSSPRFGVIFNDNSTRHSGFVSVRYLPRRELPAFDEFAALAADLIRPGGRLLHLYTQAARVGEIGGIEAAFIWPLVGTRGPLLRAYGFDRGPHGVAFLVFASEQPRIHAADFRWVKRAIVWLREPYRERSGPRAGGWYARGR